MSYRLCYGLLQSEGLAHEAAKELLLRIYRDERLLRPTAEACLAKLLRSEAVAVCRRYMAGSVAAVR
ncbi:hypothetical protein [Paenibacillus sp. NPDC058071]|uniref:hypothetical protein n=1 Tax=Paenibacillus sp. NPDC058071 TaxID=3346326 RepID=UPI0036DE1ED4